MTWCELQGIPWVLTHCHMFNISNGNCFRCFTSVFCLCSSKNPLRISQFAGNTWCFFCFFWAKNPWFPAQISPTKPRHTSTHKNPPFLMRLSPYLFGKNHGFMQIFPETNPCLIEFIYGLSRFSTVSSDSQIQMFLWLVVSNIFWIFHFIYGMSSFPLTKSYFLRWFFNHQPVVFLHKKTTPGAMDFTHPNSRWVLTWFTLRVRISWWSPTHGDPEGAVEGATFALSLAHESYSIYLYI